MDIPGVTLVICYEVEDDSEDGVAVCRMSQRMGRIRALQEQGVAIVYAETKHFDEEREKAEKAAVARAAKRKRGPKIPKVDMPPAKRRALDKTTVPVPTTPTVTGSTMPHAVVSSIRVDIESAGQPRAEEDSDPEAEVDVDVVMASIEEDEDRRMAYAVKTKQRTPRKKQEKPLDQVIDDFVNAGTRAAIGCRRKPLRLFFNSDQASTCAYLIALIRLLTLAPAESDHLTCDSSDPSGCLRCCVKAPEHCCDLHGGGKAIVDKLCPAVPFEKPSKAASRSRIQKYTHEAMDKELDLVLHTWRVRKTLQVYGEGTYRQFGADLILPEDVMDRIVDCVHHNKVATADDLRRELRWSGVDEYGEEVLSMIKNVRPTPLDASPIVVASRAALATAPATDNNIPRPLVQDTELPQGATGDAKAKRIIKCGSCQTVGHNSTFAVPKAILV